MRSRIRRVKGVKGVKGREFHRQVRAPEEKVRPDRDGFASPIPRCVPHRHSSEPTIGFARRDRGDVIAVAGGEDGVRTAGRHRRVPRGARRGWGRGHRTQRDSW
jgi:hypothetical protein